MWPPCNPSIVTTLYHGLSMASQTPCLEPRTSTLVPPRMFHPSSLVTTGPPRKAATTAGPYTARQPLGTRPHAQRAVRQVPESDGRPGETAEGLSRRGERVSRLDTRGDSRTRRKGGLRTWRKGDLERRRKSGWGLDRRAGWRQGRRVTQI